MFRQVRKFSFLPLLSTKEDSLVRLFLKAAVQACPQAGIHCSVYGLGATGRKLRSLRTRGQQAEWWRSN